MGNETGLAHHTKTAKGSAPNLSTATMATTRLLTRDPKGRAYFRAAWQAPQLHSPPPPRSPAPANPPLARWPPQTHSAPQHPPAWYQPPAHPPARNSPPAPRSP